MWPHFLFMGQNLHFARNYDKARSRQGGFFINYTRWFGKIFVVKDLVTKKAKRDLSKFKCFNMTIIDTW
jgi:hypothetical protein